MPYVEAGPDGPRRLTKAGVDRLVGGKFGGLPADVVHKITRENAGKFHGLID
jgi:hypothetical protein